MSLLTVLFEIYEALKHRQLCRSQRQFNLLWLRRSNSYLGAMKSGRKVVSADVALTLYDSLMAAGQRDLAGDLYNSIELTRRTARHARKD